MSPAPSDLSCFGNSDDGFSPGDLGDDGRDDDKSRVAETVTKSGDLCKSIAGTITSLMGLSTLVHSSPKFDEPLN